MGASPKSAITKSPTGTKVDRFAGTVISSGAASAPSPAPASTYKPASAVVTPASVTKPAPATAAVTPASVTKPASAVVTPAPASTYKPASATATVTPTAGAYKSPPPISLPYGGGMSAAMAAAIKKNPSAYPGYAGPSTGTPVKY